MQTRMIDMEVNTTLVQCYPAHEAVPDGDGPFPVVVVIHGPFGLNADTKGVANRLAREGFYVLAPDFYASPVSFMGVVPDYMRLPTGGAIGYDQPETAVLRAEGVSDGRASAIVGQAIRYAGTRAHARPGGAAVVGFSSGGRWALVAAGVHADAVRACIAFYPAGIGTGPRLGALLDHVNAVRCPVLLFYGAQDRKVPAQERDRLVAHLTRLGKNVDIQVFRDAEHDFFTSDRDTYDISSSRAAWTAMLALLRRVAW